MTQGMRKGLTSYGDADFSLFLRKAFIKAMGLTDDALSRPVVGIANTANDYNACHSNAPQLVEAIKRGVMLAGGLPMAFPTISIHESFAHPTSMFLRNLMAMDTEEMIRAQPMDSVVLIGGCDKTIPAQLMAAASVDVPAIVLPTGPMLVGHYKGEVLGACSDCRRFWAQHHAGKLDLVEVNRLTERLAPTMGTCMVMGTASSMACIVEALGIALPGSASIPAMHADRVRMAEASGRTATEMAQRGPRPAEVLTSAAFNNALTVLQALGGSTNALVHLSAIAGRRGIAIDLDAFDQIGHKVPVLVDLKPSGQHYMEDFHHAGGMPRLLREIAEYLDLSTPVVGGRTLADYIAAIEDDVPGQQVIRSLAHPLSATGGIAVLHGNLAPRGAVIKHSAATAALLQHEGRAVVFDNLEDLSTRIDDPLLDVHADDILVLRNAGPKGGAGMPEAGYLPTPKKLAREGVNDMVRISDARMSGTAFGSIVLHITPESAVGGPLACVRNGDRIRLDVVARRIDLLIGEDEMAARMRNLPAPAHSMPARGYAALFHREVLQADEGCVFEFIRPRP